MLSNCLHEELRLLGMSWRSPTAGACYPYSDNDGFFWNFSEIRYPHHSKSYVRGINPRTPHIKVLSTPNQSEIEAIHGQDILSYACPP